MGTTPNKDTTTSKEMFSPLVLVAEDNALNRRLTCDILKSRGYKVLEVANSRMVVEAVRHNHPDIVLLDISQAESNGVSILHKIRHDHDLDSIPVVTLTSKAFNENEVDKEDKKELDQFIKKPTSIRVIASRIDDILAKIKKYAER